ncbi:MAG: 16S rRNA (guanine(966)-N(2))-methyltransferase RsmD [Bacilli bacterium]
MSKQENKITIVSGLYRSKKIDAPIDKNIRPTKGRIRDAIFNSLFYLNNKVFLDLYAGSGAMGIEGISRGCKKVYFNDVSSSSIKLVNNNLKILNVDSNIYQITNFKDIDALSYYKNNDIKFDIIFIDPPYEFNDYSLIVKLINEYHLLNKDGVIIVESNKKIEIDDKLVNIYKEKKYNDIYVWYLRETI